MEPFDLIDELRDKDRHTRSDVERLRQASEIYPDCAEVWDVFGDLMQICYDNEYSIDESLDCYKKSIACDETYAPAHVSLGYAYDAHFDDFPRAAKHFRLAIAHGAGDTARIGLARVLAQLGDSNGALGQLDACADQDDDNVREMRREVSDGFWFDPSIKEA